MHIAKINRALQRRIFNELFGEISYRVQSLSRIYVFSIDRRGHLSCSPKRIRPMMGGSAEYFEEQFARFHQTRMFMCAELQSSGSQPIGILHIECYQDAETETYRLLTSLRMAEDLSPLDFRIYSIDQIPSMVMSNGELVNSSVAFRRVA